MRLRKIFKTTCLILMAIGLVQIAVYVGNSIRHKKEEQDIDKLMETSQAVETQTDLPEQTEVEEIAQAQTQLETQTLPEPVMLEKFTALYSENPDIVGWLSIDDTNINYPVMQNEDDEYYLHRSFYGEYDNYGCLYVRGMADVFTPGTNIVIYGHNMKDGAMFGTLMYYQSKDYYLAHPVISFDTLYEQRTYEVVAVFLSQVYNTDDDVFKYYQFYQADTKEEFDYFYDNIKALSLYDTQVEAVYGDTFITLSTCAYHVTDGRFVVVDKKV